MPELELCWVCGAPTGRAGEGDDSLYNAAGDGPYCEECWDNHVIPSDGPAEPDSTPTDRDHAKARGLAQQILGDVMVAADEGYTVALDHKDVVLEGWTEILEGALAQARREGRGEGLKEALADVGYGIASDEAKAQGYRSWDAENCASAIRSLLDQPAHGAKE